MHKIIAAVLLLFFCMLYSRISFAAPAHALPETGVGLTAKLNDSIQQRIASLSVKDLEKAIGHKLNFKQKIAFKLIQLNQKLSGHQNSSFPDTDEKIEKKALWAKWLGIGSLIGLLIPGVSLLCFPAAILAIILGADTINKTKHPKYSRQGIAFGITTVSLFLIAAAIVLLVLSLPVR